MKKILFIVGSLRKDSFNRQLAQEAEKNLAGLAEVTYLDYTDVPFLNQDIEYPAPAAVAKLRETVANADGIWIFTPEYNFSCRDAKFCVSTPCTSLSSTNQTIDSILSTTVCGIFQKGRDVPFAVRCNRQKVPPIFPHRRTHPCACRRT